MSFINDKLIPALLIIVCVATIAWVLKSMSRYPPPPQYDCVMWVVDTTRKVCTIIDGKEVCDTARWCIEYRHDK